MRLRQRASPPTIRAVRGLWHALLDLLYPPHCAGCGRAVAAPGFCAACRDGIRPPGAPMCPVCGLPFSVASAPGSEPDRLRRDHHCGPCLQRPPQFRRARACAVYRAATPGDPLRRALHRYKYGRDITLARPLAALVGAAAGHVVADADVIVPVPLHLSRLRWRGFNQAQLLAGPVGRAAGVPIDPHAIDRVRATRAQVELPELERRTNVRGAFEVPDRRRVVDRRVLLVDDVYTTGATVNECARVLRRAGARSVDVVVLARAVLD